MASAVSATHFCGSRLWYWFSHPAQIAFAEGAAGFGMITAVVIGPAFYFLLGRTISFHEFSAIIATSLIAGAAVALPGWEMMVPIVSVIAGTLVAMTTKILRTGNLITGRPRKA
jgi:uncharacterized membrane protein (DUF441 family)